jgi:hypothetical protein
MDGINAYSRPSPDGGVTVDVTCGCVSRTIGYYG